MNRMIVKVQDMQAGDVYRPNGTGYPEAIVEWVETLEDKPKWVRIHHVGGRARDEHRGARRTIRRPSPHMVYIEALRGAGSPVDLLCADLLELHDATGISLDDWETAKAVIRAQILALGITPMIDPNRA